MSSAARAKRSAPSLPKDWEDEFHRLKEQHDLLKKEYNQVINDNKLKHARILKLESDLAQVDRQMGTTKADRAMKDQNEILLQEMAKLSAQNSQLKERNSNLGEQLEKKKKELASARRPTSTSLKRPLSASSTNMKHEIEIVAGPNPRGMPATPVEHPVVTGENWQAVAQQFKARLATAQEQISLLKDEITRLKASTNSVKGTVTVEADNHDLKWRLQQLQQQYDYTVSKLTALSESSKHSEVKLEEYHQKVKELRRALEELRYEKEASDAKASRVEALEETITELRQQNRSLDDKIQRLCEAPFISDAFGLHESKMRYEDLAAERGDLLAKVEHLQEAVRTHFSALTSLKQQASQFREEKEETEKIAEGLRIQLQELQAGQNLMQDQLRLYSGDDGVDVATLERALTMVKRASEPYGKLPFLEDPEGEKLVSLPAVKRKLEEYQILNLRLTEENERLETMLKLQTGISKDLHKELEALVRSKDKDKQDLQQKASDFEEIALKRLDKIHSLEAQVRQYVYGLSKSTKAPRAAKEVMMITPDGKASPALETDETDNALLNELIEDKGGNIRDDENLMEIWVRGATIREGNLVPGSSTFVVIDFFDYESQTTSLLSGIKPQWDFAATYKITVDDFLLRYLATDTVTLELNMASQGDFAMLARCSIPLSALLKSRPRLQLVNHPMLSVNTGQVIAHITVDIRLALPVSELYRLFLERHPVERRQIEEISAKRVLDAAANNELARNLSGNLATALTSSGKEDDSRLYNELEVLIHRAAGLPMSADGKPPNAYVHFQLLGHPDKLTNPIMNTTSPEFNEKFNFPMVTYDQQVRLLQRSQLQLSVIDMKGEEMDMKDEGLIGEVFVKLAALADGAQITDTFNVKNTDGKNIAELYVTLKWKHPLKRHRDLGPRALSGVEVETLISAFSPGDMHEGVIDYRSFCRFIDPPRHVLTAMEKLRAFCLDITEQEGRSARDIFKVLLEPAQYYDEDTFVQRMLKTQVDVLPIDLVNLFKFIDSTEEQRITLDKFLAVLNLDEIAGLPVLLQNKLRDRTSDLNSRGIPVLKLFQEADQWGADGLITRQEFKKVLKNRMGFALVDEPDPVHEFIGSEFGEQQQHSGKGRGAAAGMRESAENEILNDTLGSEDNILIQNDLGRDADAAAHSVIGAGAVMKQNREIFEGKVADLHQRSQAVLAAEQRNMSAKSAPIVDGGVSLSVENLKDPYQGGVDHRVSVASNAGRQMSLDPTVTDKLATKLQSHYRGHMARKATTPLRQSKQGGVTVPSPLRVVLPTEDYTQNLAGASSILAVENILYDSLKANNKDHALPDLAAGFLTVDKRRTGLVNRKQFAHVLKQFPVVQLYGAELRAAMDFFDVSSDGTSIDYNAFLRLYNYREPELIPAILKLQTMTLGKSSFAHFRRHDQSGNGYIRRSEMMKCLKELGHGVIAQSVMQTMLQLFEVRLDGQVNYINFYEYIRENDLTQKLDALSAQFFHLITGSSSPHDPAVREWFSRLDSQNAGRFLIQQLSLLLQQHEVHTTKEAIVALYSQLDLDGTGVSFSRLTNWLAAFADSAKDVDAELSMFSNLSMAELQKKASTYILAAAQSPMGLEMVSDSYLVYDWRRSDAGAIAKPLFVRATRRAGFPFTMNELRTLTSEFSLQNNGEVVSYKQFLSWSTPDPRAAPLAGIAVQDGVASLDGHPGGSIGTPRKNAGMITKFLEKCVLRGIDLLTVFGRYDSISVGRVTSSEFCSALSDMGLSSVTQHEALEFADRYRAAAGDFIIYRKIVSTLLRHTDETTGAADVDPVEVLRGALLSSNVSLRRLHDVFEYYDRKGNGNVRREDLETIMDEAKLRIKRFEIDLIADKFTTSTDSGWMNYTPIIKILESRMVERSMFKKPSNIPDEISAKMKAFIETWILQGIDYRTEFDYYDDNYTGTILQSQFREILSTKLLINLTIKEIEILENIYRSTEDQRKVNFTRMIHYLHPRNFGRNINHTNSSNNSNNNMNEPWEIAELLRQKIRKRVKFQIPGELRKPYQHFTRSKNITKNVTQSDFSIAIRNLGLRLAGDQEKAVFEIISHNTSKTFSYNDFVVFVCDPQHIDIIWKLRKLIAKARISEKEIITALNNEDSNASGLITVKQFIRAMKSCSIQLTDRDAMRLLLRFDVEDNQHFDNDRFFKFLRGRQYEEENITEEREDLDEAITRRLMDVATRQSAEAVESHTWTSLKQRVEDKLDAGFTGNEVFAMFDRDGRGTLDMAALTHGIQRLGLTLTNAEVRSMLRRMSVLAGGSVNKASFFEALDIDLRQFAVDDRDLVGGERGRRIRRSKMGVQDDDEEDEGGERAVRLAPREDFTLILERIREQMEITVNPRDRVELPQVLRRALDKNGLQKNGFVTERELGRAFESLGVRAQKSEILRIFDKLDLEDIGMVAHEDIVGKIFPDAAVKGRGAELDVRADSDIRVALRKRPDLLEEVVSQLKTIESKTEKTLDDLLTVFRKADYDRSGTLGKADFAASLAKFGFKLVAGLERDLVDTLTERSARLVRYQDFIDALRVDIKTDSVLDDVILRLRKHFSRGDKHGLGIEEVFRNIDKDGDGQVDVYEFETALDKIGIPLSREEAKRIVAKFSVNGTTIRFREFLKAFHAAPAGASAAERLEPIISHIRNTLERTSAVTVGTASYGRLLKRAFESCDANGNGQLSEKEFMDAMKSLKVDLLPSEVRQIFRLYDSSGDGSLDYSEFLALMNTTTASTAKGKDPRIDGDCEAVLKVIRRKLEDYLGPGASSARRIKQTFAEIDRNRNGKIDKREFEQAMSMLKVELDRADVALLFDRFDTDRNGLDYKEFLDLLNFDGSAAKISAQLKEETDLIVARIRRKLEDYLGPGANSAKKIKEAFADIDRNRNGKIDKTEFQDAMANLRVEVARPDLALLFERFDTDRNGLDYVEFMDLLGFDSAASKVSAQLKADTDAIVDRVRRNLEDYLGPGAGSARKIKEAFAEMDRNRNGKLDKLEFQDAMNVLRVRLDRADVALLFDRFDTDRNGLDYKEFLDLLNFDGSAAKISAQLKEETDIIVARIRRKLEDYVGPGAVSGRKIKQTFAEMDRNRNGTIDKAEFQEAMLNLRVDLPRSEVALLFDRFDTNRNGLDYVEFMDLLGYGSAGAVDDNKADSGVKINPQLRDDTDAILSRIRMKLEDYLGPGASSARRIKETFAEIDRDRNGSIDKVEFQQAMDTLRVNLTPQDVRLLFDRFDSTGRGLDYREFMDLIGFQTSSPRHSHRSDMSESKANNSPPQLKDDTDAILSRIRRKLEDYLGPGSSSAHRIKEVFAEIDRDRSGTIDKVEFTQAMDTLRVNVTPSEVRQLFERFDTGRRGLDYKEFMDLIGFQVSPRRLRF